MRRKLTLIAATVALGALLVTGATLAWFTSTDTATNTVTVGNVKIEIEEKTDDTNVTTKEDGTFEWNDMTPGQILSKKPAIVNKGANKAWVRASVNVVYSKDGVEITLPDGVDPVVINYNTGTDGNQWTKDGDFYYYNTALEVSGKGNTTSDLFTTVTIPNTWTNDTENGYDMSGVKVDVNIDAHAVQYDNNNTKIVEGEEVDMTAVEAFVAFDTQKKN